ncbi:ABC transporter ATP-binding protein [Actibacterium sp. 188UL27-1]|uniref:ABC transporter ATP-binding protein n=1 Tax=Actibacterium sp. 188UL27-1 TaxID=2786961 RepID=UPI001956D659|nr:ABC transporter ATP-binding protein [Actibacterium sp. 188UL27-1]MBM7069008.1 ABC transporter ATP-binding protein [Actibacterium sp. 188UL27-1]
MAEAVLSAHGLCKSFGAVQATHDVSIDVRPGEIHAVIGPNGAGKSTLIAQLCGSMASDAGRVELLGRDVTHDTVRRRAQAGLARTFQISALAMEDTVLQNAMLGALGAAGRPWRFLRPALGDQDLRDRAEAALERVGLQDVRAARVAALSHGQRRQLEVALALTLSPKAFIMDEPMAGLGGEGSKLLTDLLSALRADAPILLVEHDMDAVFTLADRISVLVYGQIIETGTVDQIRRSPAVRDAYLGEGA